MFGYFTFLVIDSSRLVVCFFKNIFNFNFENLKYPYQQHNCPTHLVPIFHHALGLRNENSLLVLLWLWFIRTTLQGRNIFEIRFKFKLIVRYRKDSKIAILCSRTIYMVTFAEKYLQQYCQITSSQARPPLISVRSCLGYNQSEEAWIAGN